MSQDSRDPNLAPQERDGDKDHVGRPWLISVAFVTALVFGPLVIATGFLTQGNAAQGSPDDGCVDLGGSPLLKPQADRRFRCDADLQRDEIPGISLAAMRSASKWDDP